MLKLTMLGFLQFMLLFCLIKADIQNENVERSLDLTSQLVKESIKIIAADTQPIKNYKFMIPVNAQSYLASISAKDGTKKELKITERVLDKKRHYNIEFFSSSTTQIIYVDLVFSNYLVPHPEQISQSEKQLIKYEGNMYLFSPYKTLTQTTNVKLSSANMLSYSQMKPLSVSSNKIKYGPYESVEAFSMQPLVLHYENHSPFVTVKYLERTIEVSHWGNIAIKENIILEHTGAKLKGSFSRYDFQKDGRSGQSAIKSYKTILPSSASEVYYRDSNGNISTSNMRVLRDSVELELRPRFPLFGGWKTQYTLGYNVPSFEYLYNSQNNYNLKMRVVDHIYDDMIIESAVVKIILPEGVSDIQLNTPYPVNRSANSLHFTYLDTVGRTVVEFSKSNLIENHISDFNLKYTFSKVSLLQEPVLIILFIFLIFIITIITLRLDFSINHYHKD